jgi:hypothetical protein
MASQRSASFSDPSLSTSQSLQHAAAVGIALVAVSARCYIAWRTHFTAESALTTLRYAENLAAGHGFTYNPGEHKLGVSGPLYALLLSVFSSYAHVNALFVGKACNIAADGATCYLLARLLARSEIARPVEGLFAAALYAFSSSPIIVSISGTEIGLVTCVGLAMVYAYVARRPYWLYTLGAALYLMTIYGLILFAILAAALALRERKLPLRAGAVALIVIIPWLIFSTAYFGSPIPTRLSSTTTFDSHFDNHNLSPDSGNRQDNLQAITSQFASGWYSCSLSLLFSLGAILVVCQAMRRAERGVMVAPLIWSVLYICLIHICAVHFGADDVSAGGTFAWIYVPAWPVFVAIASLAGATAPIKFGKMMPDIASAWSERAVPGALAVVVLIGIVHVRSTVFEIEAFSLIPGPARAASSGFKHGNSG